MATARRDARAGQATVESVALVAAIALLAVSLVAWRGSGLADTIAAAVRGTFRADAARSPLSGAARAVLDQAARGDAGAPSLLAAQALAAAEVGTRRADELVRTTALRAFVRRFGDLGWTAEEAGGLGPPLRVRRGGTEERRPQIVVTGPLRVARIASTADEERARHPTGRGGPHAAAEEALGSALLGRVATSGGALAMVLGGSETRALQIRGAIESSGSGLRRLLDARSREVEPRPGARAGDVVLCRPVGLRYHRGDGVSDIVARGVRVVVVRNGRPFAPMILAEHDCGRV